MEEAEEKIAWLVYWDDYGQDAYTNGSCIRFEWDGSVIFENEEMPPGFPVKEWYSETDYRLKRREPELPILREKETYHIFADKQDTPEGGSFLRLNFYDQKGDLLEFRMISENEGTFAYPEGAFRYSLQLVQGGASRILFRRIEIVPEQNWKEWHPGIAEKFRNGVNRTCRWQDGRDAGRKKKNFTDEKTASYPESGQCPLRSDVFAFGCRSESNDGKTSGQASKGSRAG